MSNEVGYERPRPSGWALTFYNQWPAVLTPSKWNWVDFTVLHLGLERAGYAYSWEFSVGVLGLNWVLTAWNRGDT